MIRKKTLIGAAALAVGPLALMAPANAYYSIGDCTVSSGASDAGVTLSVYNYDPSHWQVTGHISDGHGRTWKWKFYSEGDVMYSGTRTGTGDVDRYWVKRAGANGSEHIRFHAENAAGTVVCNASLDT